VAAEAPLPTAVQPAAAIATVGSVARALVGAGNLGELAEHALAAMCQALGLRVAALYLPEADDVPILRRFAVSGADVDAIALIDELRFEQEAWRLASAGGRALVFHEPATWLVANPFDPPASAWLVLPLDAGDEVLGVVAAAQRHPLALEETSATVLAILGDLLGAGIAAARLRQRIAHTEVERERLRLAADIHDGLAQDLALAKREIALLDSDPGAEQAGESRARLREAVGAAHRIVRARLEDLSTRVPIGGLHDAVLAACERARERGVPVELHAAATVEPTEPEVAAVVLRVLGEALANVERHAQAGHVLVTLDGGQGALALTVEDDGRGLGTLDHSGPGDGHFGLALMRERAASIGGRLAVGPGAAGGTRIRLEVPRA
jgi:signal transduction histidine kinase